MSISSAQDVGSLESAGQGWSWTVDPLDRWSVVPADRSESFEVIDAWEHKAADNVLAGITPTIAEALASGGTFPAEDREQLVRRVVASVEHVRTFAENVPSGTRVVALTGIRGRGPVPVLANVSISEPGTSDDELMEVLGATGGNPVNPPSVEYLELPDGDGIRVTRLDLDTANGQAWLTVGLARRTEHPDAVADTVVVWRTRDLTIAEPMLDELDELLSAVRVMRSNS